MPVVLLPVSAIATRAAITLIGGRAPLIESREIIESTARSFADPTTTNTHTPKL